MQACLPNGHPFEIGTDSIHLTLVDADTTIFDERCFGVIKFGGAIPIGVVRNLFESYQFLLTSSGAGLTMVVPNWDPGE